eukprot:8155864-Pyramimonas_sp.AAC.1
MFPECSPNVPAVEHRVLRTRVRHHHRHAAGGRSGGGARADSVGRVHLVQDYFGVEARNVLHVPCARPRLRYIYFIFIFSASHVQPGSGCRSA